MIIQEVSTKPFNPFYNLPSLAPPKPSDLRDELDRYLSTDPESVDNVLLWWHGKRATFPTLSRMALDYLSIPGVLTSFESLCTCPNKISSATSTDVERTFSKGRILLSHLRNRLSVQSTRALMCLGVWSLLGYVEDEDVLAVAKLDDIPEGEEEEELEEGWDAIL